MAEEEKKTEIKEKAAVDKTATVNHVEPETKENPTQKFDYQYTNAEESFKTKAGEHQVKVSKTVDKLDERKPIISETVSHKFQGKKQNSSDIKTTIDTYSTIGGHRTQTTEFSHDNTYYDKDKKKIKKMVEGMSEHTTNASDGTLAISGDKTDAYSFGYDRVKTTTYNKDETISSIKQHETTTSSSYNSQTDAYTEMKKGEVKKSLRAEATSHRMVIRAIENKKNKEFFAEVTAKGDERYLKTQKGKQYDISVEDGIASGRKQILDKSGQNIVSEKELSRKQLKKELNAMRKEADETVAKVSNAKTAEEYLNAIPAQSKVARVGLSDVFDADMGALKKAEPEVMAKHQEQVKEKAGVTAEQILQMKKQQLQQK